MPFDFAEERKQTNKDIGLTDTNGQALNPSEAVYGFAAWLTTRKERTVMSHSDDSAIIASLVEKFCRVNKLPDVSEEWPHNLIIPCDEWSVD